jgi:signal transduction histidine kinase
MNEPVWRSAARELLRRAVENVIRNAIRHAPPETSLRWKFASSFQPLSQGPFNLLAR